MASLKETVASFFRIQPPSFFRVTLQRSSIGLPRKTRAVLESLGLKRRHQVVFHRVGPDAAGMIFRVKELVEVEEVPEALTKAQVRAARSPDRGFEVQGNVRRGGGVGGAGETGGAGEGGVAAAVSPSEKKPGA